MIISMLVSQDSGGIFDLLYLVLPLLMCYILFGQGRSGDKQNVSTEVITESWYTIEKIDDIYSKIEEEVKIWKKEAEESKTKTSGGLLNIGGLFRRNTPQERYVIKEKIQPRLYRLSDNGEPLFFELTEVEGGGTVVKTTYGYYLKAKMAKFKAAQPLKIPATPIGDRCPACGKSVLPEFNLCPYCGEKIIKGN